MEPLILRLGSDQPSPFEMDRRDHPISEDFAPRPVVHRGQTVKDPGTRLTEVARETLDDD